jgi:hypothetical protein
MKRWAYAGVLMMGMAGTGAAQDIGKIGLPPPETAGGMPLMQALQVRHSTREFGSRACRRRRCRICCGRRTG